ncbi:MAG: methyltransferase domain-containing protein, partial [Alphaproteobacteria bacterium]|nr:methyltransferase domain-containing protein [Alphaproteobacteria bacterium]
MSSALKFSERKNAIRELSDRVAPSFEKWRDRNDYFHQEDERYTSFLATGNSDSILDLGCGNGDLLASLAPKRGVGIDFSEKTIEAARERHPDQEFHVG